MIILQNEMNVSVHKLHSRCCRRYFACILSFYECAFFDLDLVFLCKRVERGQFGEMNVKILRVLKSEPKPGLNYVLRTHYTQCTHTGVILYHLILLLLHYGF